MLSAASPMHRQHNVSTQAAEIWYADLKESYIRNNHSIQSARCVLWRRIFVSLGMILIFEMLGGVLVVVVNLPWH